MIPVLRILFAVAAFAGVAGIVSNVLDRDWLDLVLACGLTLLYSTLAIRPDLLSKAGEQDSSSAASLGARLALVLLFLYLMLSLL